MILNLQTRKKKTFDLTLLDGSVLNIRKPSEDMVIELEKTEEEIKKATCFKDIAGIIKTQVLAILNNNTNHRLFNEKLFEKDEAGEQEYDYDVCMAIFTAYNKFTNEVLSDPN